MLTNITSIANGGTNNYGVYSQTSGTVKINHSVISGATTVYCGTGVVTRLANTQLDGGAAVNTGTLTCAGVFDENYIFYASSCP